MLLLLLPPLGLEVISNPDKCGRRWTSKNAIDLEESLCNDCNLLRSVFLDYIVELWIINCRSSNYGRTCMWTQQHWAQGLREGIIFSMWVTEMKYGQSSTWAFTRVTESCWQIIMLKIGDIRNMAGYLVLHCITNRKYSTHGQSISLKRPVGEAVESINSWAIIWWESQFQNFRWMDWLEVSINCISNKRLHWLASKFILH